MVTASPNYLNSRVRADAGEGYDGVVRIAIDGYYGTGVLLYGGRAALTVAHLFDGVSAAQTASIHFETASGKQTITSSSFLVNPNYDSVNVGSDLALVWLSQSAPIAAERYSIYHDSNEIGQQFTMVGYGTPGVGTTGKIENYDGEYLRLMGENRFDMDAKTLKNIMGSSMAWDPVTATQLLADFDDGTTSHDALGLLGGVTDAGTGVLESIISSGDSGGPAFINGVVAGIASYVTSLNKYNANPDIDDALNSSFGEIAAWQRVSYYQQWIDQNIRAHYQNAPASPSEVQKSVYEGDSGTTYTYFLLQFTGMRTDPNQLISVDYSTADGTAKAGEDYIATNGRLILYPNENQAVIPVEIIGDTHKEPDEIFYLNVFNPVGGSFGEGVVQLVAIRTILNDDAWA